MQSAFNGLAVYHVGALARHNATGCRFEGSRMSRICEHVPFSLCLGRHGLRLGVLSRRPARRLGPSPNHGNDPNLYPQPLTSILNRTAQP